MVDNVFNSVTRVCSTIAAFWALALAFLILYDISGRFFFNSPFDGTIEIVANSMVSILFLQMPYTIYRGAHLRTAVIYQNLGDYGQRTIDFIVALLGIWFFFSIALGAWEDMTSIEETGISMPLPFLFETRAEAARLRGDGASRERDLREAEQVFNERGATAHADRIAALLG